MTHDYVNPVQSVEVEDCEIHIVGVYHKDEESYERVRDVAENVEPDIIFIESGVGRLGFYQPEFGEYPKLQSVRESLQHRIPAYSIVRLLRGERCRWHKDYEEFFDLGQEYDASIVPADMKDEVLMEHLESCDKQEYKIDTRRESNDTPSMQLINGQVWFHKNTINSSRNSVTGKPGKYIFDKREKRMASIVRWVLSNTNGTAVFPVGLSHLMNLRDEIKQTEETLSESDKRELREYGVLSDGPLSEPTCPNYLTLSENKLKHK